MCFDPSSAAAPGLAARQADYEAKGYTFDPVNKTFTLPTPAGLPEGADPGNLTHSLPGWVTGEEDYRHLHLPSWFDAVRPEYHDALLSMFQQQNQHGHRGEPLDQATRLEYARTLAPALGQGGKAGFATLVDMDKLRTMRQGVDHSPSPSMPGSAGPPIPGSASNLASTIGGAMARARSLGPASRIVG